MAKRFGIKDRIIIAVAMKFAGRRLEDMFGKNWKGKAGGIGMMLVGGAGVLNGLNCIIQNLIGGADVGITDCLSNLGEGAGIFAAGLGVFGIRQAIGSSKDQGKE